MDSSQKPSDFDLRIQQMNRLCEISVTLNSTQELKPLLQYILETASDILACEAASIMLYDDKQNELIFAATRDTDQAKFEHIVVPIEGSIAGTIFKDNTPLVINDVQADPRHYKAVGTKTNFQPRSLVGVPMNVREKPMGVLEALNKTDGVFTDNDIHLLEIIANQAAVAIHNARMHQALQSAYDDLSRVDKIKSDFMAVASHELRTPLGIILGYANFLKEETEGELKLFTEKILSASIHLRTLLEDMTNMNLMNIGEMELYTIPVVLQKTLKEALDEVQQAIRASNHKLIIDVHKQPLKIQVDPEKIKTALVNVLNNAIRFTPSDGAITLQVYPRDDRVWIKIADNGIGIPPDELDKIFEPFYQVEYHMIRRFGGLGLGLTIAKGIVELHKGNIWAESQGNQKGTVVTITLPYNSGV